MRMLDDAGLKPIAVYTVSDLNAYIRALLESNENLMDIWVSGEVSNLSQPRSGHIYFTLKDENAQVRCVIWRNHALRLAGQLRDGLLVDAHGAVGVYENGGQYQLYVDGIRAAGEGRLYQEFLLLKEKLQAEGLFDPERKRSIPAVPGIIGIVTSATGAALQDMLNTLRVRYPIADVVLSPASVQGDAAPLEIVAALDRLNQIIHPDVILLGRGGGSLEDLWAFNDERVVRAVVRSEAPVISGVGHETDFTLTDFAADLRAPTPTGAAVSAVPDRIELSAIIKGYERELDMLMRGYIEKGRALIQAGNMQLSYNSPSGKIRQYMQAIDHHAMEIDHLKKNYFADMQRSLAVDSERLLSHDPRNILKRGYAIITDKKGRSVSSIKQVQLDQEIDARVFDGVIRSTVNETQPIEEQKNDKEK